MRALGALLALALAGAGGWQSAAPLPEPRTEVAAAVVAGEIAVVGGFTETGTASARVDAYSPALDRWRRLPDLPAGVHHAMAASDGKRLYVAGGYGSSLGFGEKLATVFVLERGAWRSLPRLPAPRAAGGAAIVAGKLYVVGGVGAAGLAREVFALDLAKRRWSVAPGPTPREHLAVVAAAGRVYALAGRTGGIGTNVTTFEVYTPGARRWRALPPVPDARGGTAAAVAGGLIVSVGGEESEGTIGSVYAYDLAAGRWRRLPDLPTPRHGLGAAAVGSRVYAVAGGTEPGLSVSGANEVLELP